MVGRDDVRAVAAPRTLRWVVVVLAGAQAVAPLIAGALAPNFLAEDPAAEATITPAGYAFAIWGLICLLSLVTAVAIARFGLGSRWEGRALADLAVVFLGFSVWLYAAGQDWLWVTVGIFAAMFVALVDVMRLLIGSAADLRCPRWLARLTTLTFGLYLGWASIAVFVNLAAALIGGGWSTSGTGALAWQLVLLVAATATALWLNHILRATPGYVAGALWALVAAAVGAFGRDAGVLGGAAAAGAAALVGSIILARAASR